MNRFVSRMFASGVILLIAAVTAQAQVTPSKIVIGPPNGDHLFGALPPDARKPAADPRDLTGVYVPFIPANLGAAPPGGGGGRPPSPGGPTQESDATGSSGTTMEKCLPNQGFGGNPYAEEIFQTAGRVSFIYEYNHVLRTVYLNRRFPAHITPSYAGYSIGHWDGDTLVIETRGIISASSALMAGVAKIVDTVERVKKLDGGKMVDVDLITNGFDAGGKPISANMDYREIWRPDLHLLEFICEDSADLFFDK